MKIVEGIVAALIAVVVVFITLQVFWRYVLRDPLVWTEQTSRYIFVWICMLGAPVAFYKGASFSFDLLVNALPKAVQVVIDVIITVCELIFCGYWAYWTFRLIKKIGWRLTEGVVIPMGYLYAAQIVCAVLLAIVLLYLSIKRFKRDLGKEAAK